MLKNVRACFIRKTVFVVCIIKAYCKHTISMFISFSFIFFTDLMLWHVVGIILHIHLARFCPVGLIFQQFNRLRIIINLLFVARWMVCNFKTTYNNGNGVFSPGCSQLSCGFFVLKDDIMLNAWCISGHQRRGHLWLSKHTSPSHMSLWDGLVSENTAFI